ncbi:inositol monophosphatase 3 [Striga asiatica]|uniref:Inositol monophosphatase 3 n=1 Tax=Striga asiatica TaxID=4170 RepID=A0A5A7Q0C9_STRAF|nr:inositol monophosphatase 3 [Striga asiatica]
MPPLLAGRFAYPSANTTPPGWAYLINEAGGKITELAMAVTELPARSTSKKDVPIERTSNVLKDRVNDSQGLNRSKREGSPKDPRAKGSHKDMKVSYSVYPTFPYKRL